MSPPAAVDSSFDPATFDKVRQALRQLVSARSMDAMFAAPALLSARWQAALRQREHEESPEVRAVLAQLGAVTEKLRQGPWPLGQGPLDALFVKVSANKEMTRKTALALAAGADVGWRLSPNYVRRMCSVAERWAREGDWRRGVLLAELVLAALDARRGRLAIDQAQMDLIATNYWLDVVTRAVSDLPDGRLLRDAAERGERLADVIVDPDDYFFPAMVLHGLGLLYLDPYVGGRSTANYEGQLRTWHARFRLQLDAENTAWDEETMSVPEPALALAKAAGYLARAAEHRTGEQRGMSLKGQLQALVWQRVSGGVPPPGEAERVGAQARRLLDGPEQVGLRADIDNLLEWNAIESGEPEPKPDLAVPVDDIAALLATPLEHWPARTLPVEIIEIHLQAARSIEDRDPRLAFALWTKVQGLGWAQSETRRLQFFQRVLGTLLRLDAPDVSPGETLASAAVRWQSSDAVASERALGLLALALRSTGTRNEAEGIAILQAGRGADAGFARRYERLIAMLHASLVAGAAVNHFDQHRFEDAARLYLVGARAYLACDCPDLAYTFVVRVTDLVARGSDEALAHFIVEIEDLAPPLELQVPGAAERLQGFYRDMVARMVSQGRVKPLVLLLMVERAKGNSFARALIGGAPLAWLESDAAAQMATQLAGLRGEQPATRARTAADDDFELLLCSYPSPFEQAGGATAGERLTNVMIAFDNEVGRAQAAQGLTPKWLATDAAVQAALGPRSALLVLYVGAAPDGSLALFLMLLSNETCDLRIGQLPGFTSDLIAMTFGEATVSAMPFAPWLAGLRGDVQDEPFTRKVSANGAVALEDAAANLLGGGLRELLRDLHAAGKDHLCVWAHGPFHFLPFHLLGKEGAPLADDWSVTTLPSLQLLDPSRRGPSSRAAFAAIGLDFPAGNARGLPALSGAEAEAGQVADAMHAPRALVGAAVSKAAVLDALRTHQRVHIATHGELPVNAPAFQTLYLGTERDGDVLHAWEVLRLDLGGVDLVTLSACETSLGRLDIGDNLRGFSANLLIAGVSTIIGTLWPVETNCAKSFFTRLYTEIDAEAAKGAAFRTAQLATRARFPKYRDWGAFYLSGAVD